MKLRIRKEVGIFLVAFAVVAFIFLIAYEAIDYWDKTTNTLASSDSSSTTSSSVIKIDGVSYTQKEHITTMLLLGIDNTGEMVSSGSYINDGQSDFITVIVLDEDEDTYALLQINRDTMTEVRQLGVGGNVVKTTVMQIALSHSYGDGMEDSCENSIIAVENFLCGVSLDHYLAMNMTAVELLVDYVGGVTVTILDDFSEVDETLVLGETMTLSGS
ncbi:MAG: LCP family protein [Clostridia bacterium]|nr:LCP family protein [Clostridia bacterium]